VLKCLGGAGTPALSPLKDLGFIKSCLIYVPTIIVDVVVAEMKQAGDPG
jgi:flagellar biosynthesis protein FliP